MRIGRIKQLNILATVLSLLLIVNIRLFADTRPGKIDKTARGSVVVRFTDVDNKPITGGNTELFRVAGIADDVNGNDIYVTADDFKNSGLDCNQILDAEFASDAALYVEANDISGDVRVVDKEGTVKYDGLEPGIYLITQPIANTGWYPVEPYIVTVPLYNNGIWEYDVDSIPKTEPMRPVPTPTSTPTGNNGSTITATPYPTQVITPIPDDGDDSSITPTPIPTDGGNLTGGAENELPQTGRLNWPVPILAFSGLVLFIIGYGVWRRDA